MATRYCKLADSYAAFVGMASWIIETRTTRRSATLPVYGDPRAPEYNSQIPLV